MPNDTPLKPPSREEPKDTRDDPANPDYVGDGEPGGDDPKPVPTGPGGDPAAGG